MKRFDLALGLIAVGASSLLASQAHAYGYRYCDCNSAAQTDPYYARKWDASTVSFDIEVADPDWRATIISAGSHWNRRSGMEIQFGTTGANDIVATDGCSNDIGLLMRTSTSASDCYDGGIVACRPSRINEADIEIFTKIRKVRSDGSTYCDFINWTPFPTTLDAPYPQSQILAITLQHEIGHALGLIHSDTGLARMESSYPGGGWFHSDVPATAIVVPFEDDIRGLQYLYSASGPNHTRFSDVYASSWVHRATPAGTDHNQFINTVPITQVGSNVSHFPRNRVDRGNNRKTVKAGDRVDIRISAANRGDASYTEPTPVRCFLSRDVHLTVGADFEVDCNWTYNPLDAFSHWTSDISFVVPTLPSSPQTAHELFYVFWWLDTGSSDPNNYSYLQHRVAYDD